MLYLTTLGSNDLGADKEKKENLQTIEIFLQSNPILEEFSTQKLYITTIWVNFVSNKNNLLKTDPEEIHETFSKASSF